MSVASARAEQERVLSLFTLLPEVQDVFPEWQRLVVAHDVKGKNSHDARLVAAMRFHAVGQILTFNGSDFARPRYRRGRPGVRRYSRGRSLARTR
jgi:hypothetical protein